jgi:type 1 glutamine amidotransferase
MSNLTRRDLLKGSAAAAAAAALGRLSLGADAAPLPPRKVLFFTKSSGYQHSVIDRHATDEPAYAERILVGLGQQHGLDVTASKDGGLFTPERLATFDAFVFYTTGDLTQPGTDKQPPMPADGKAALLAAIAGGKGFVGIHSASDTFHGHGGAIDPYLAMLGGEFVPHGKQQKATQHVVDAKFPGGPSADFALFEEWYPFVHLAPDLHVILMQETQGMQGVMYQRPPYPSTWARQHGKGRVFYTSMGHREDVWTDDTFASLLMGGLAWAVGTVEAEVAPNQGK